MSVERVTMSCKVLGQITQNVVHFENLDGALTPAQIVTELTTTGGGHWIDSFRGAQHTSAEWYDIEVRRLATTTAPYHATISMFGTGSSLSAGDHPSIGAVLQFRTLVAGRHGRGRMFIPGCSSAGMGNGAVTPSALAARAPFILAMENRYCHGVGSPGLSLVICPHGDVSSIIHVDSIVQRSLLGHQRRRQIGTGI